VKTFFVVRETAEYLVEGETAHEALNHFSEHGRFNRELCPTMTHSRSSAMCTGEWIEAENKLDALVVRDRNEAAAARKRPQ